MKIWRVENKEGIGCYSGVYEGFVYRMMRRHEKKTYTPTPYKDIGIERNIKIGEICGFVDKIQALHWFSQYELKNLKELGFELKEVEVAYISAKGEKQVLAVRQK